MVCKVVSKEFLTDNLKVWRCFQIRFCIVFNQNCNLHWVNLQSSFNFCFFLPHCVFYFSKTNKISSATILNKLFLISGHFLNYFIIIKTKKRNKNSTSCVVLLQFCVISNWGEKTKIRSVLLCRIQQIAMLMLIWIIVF